jgi:O-antigen ligase
MIGKLDKSSYLQILFVGILATFIVLQFPSYLLVLLSIGIIFFIKNISFQNLIILSLILFISATGATIDKYRTYFTIFSGLTLLYFFFRERGLQFSYYRIPPKEIMFLMTFLFGSIFFSTAVAGFSLQSLLAIIRSVFFFIICYVLFSLLEFKKLIFAYIIAIILSSIIVSLTVYFDLINAGLTVYIVQGVLARYSGIYGNPNYVGLLISMSTIILFVYLISNKTKSKFEKNLILIILISNTIILLITNSRTAILGTIISVLFSAYHVKKVLFKRILIPMVLVSVVFVMLSLFQEFTDAFIRLETVSERGVSWETGWIIMKDNFWFGIGPELYETKIFSYVPSTAWQLFIVDTNIFKVHPHNYFILMVTENGVPGLLLSLMIFYFYFRLAWRIMKRTKLTNRILYALSISLYCIGLILFIRAFFEVDGIYSYGNITRDLPFWICYVILAHLTNIYSSRMPDNINYNN